MIIFWIITNRTHAAQANFLFNSGPFCDIIRGMKTKILIFSSLLSLCGANVAHASECIGAGCDVQPIISEPPQIGIIQTPDVVADVIGYDAPVEYTYAEQIPMRQVKLLTVKPVEYDDRPALWDGTDGTYRQQKYDKTVDWRDGVPIWDDSIVSYRDKDFSDWFLEPLPELYIRDVDAPTDVATELYNQNMADAAATRARVEELLAPKKPCDNLWTDDVVAPRDAYTAQDMTETVQAVFGATDDGCPFETETECNIWRRKPIVRETVSPRSPKLQDARMAEFVAAASCNTDIDATDPAAEPLVARYKMLMNSANACCTDGLVYSLKRAGASDGLVYKFMADDANFYGFGARCLMMTDKELDTKYPNTATAAVAADVRNGCLCRGRQWFNAMLAPFNDAYAAVPEFKDAKFNYTYTDGVGREITVSINNDVQNVMYQLTLCP